MVTSAPENLNIVFIFSLSTDDLRRFVHENFNYFFSLGKSVQSVIMAVIINKFLGNEIVNNDLISPEYNVISSSSRI